MHTYGPVVYVFLYIIFEPDLKSYPVGWGRVTQKLTHPRLGDQQTSLGQFLFFFFFFFQLKYITNLLEMLTARQHLFQKSNRFFYLKCSISIATVTTVCWQFLPFIFQRVALLILSGSMETCTKEWYWGHKVRLELNYNSKGDSVSTVHNHISLTRWQRSVGSER